MKYQIRRIISFICILACGFNLVSCVKNPEKRIVVDKAEGLSKENVLPNERMSLRIWGHRSIGRRPWTGAMALSL